MLFGDEELAPRFLQTFAEALAAAGLSVVIGVPIGWFLHSKRWAASAYETWIASLAAIAFRYAVAPAIEQAIKKTGKADRKAIRDALEEVDVPNTPVGRIKFDDTHQAFINMLLVEINGGQLKVLEKIPIQP